MVAESAERSSAAKLTVMPAEGKPAKRRALRIDQEALQARSDAKQAQSLHGGRCRPGQMRRLLAISQDRNIVLQFQHNTCWTASCCGLSCGIRAELAHLALDATLAYDVTALNCRREERAMNARVLP